MVFYWSLSNSKSPQVSRTLLSILADLNNDVVWIVSTRLLISQPSSPFNDPLVTVTSASITIGMTVNYYYDFTFGEFFKPAFDDCRLVEFEWHQVFSGLQDSSQNSDQFQQCCSLKGLDASSDPRLFQSPLQAFGDRSKCTSYNWHHCNLHVSQLS